jgi:hypothetical protein
MLISFRFATIMENVTIAAVAEGVKVEEERSADVGPPSIDVEPDLKSNWYLDRSLQENFVLKQAVNLWQGSKLPRLLYTRRTHPIFREL